MEINYIKEFVVLAQTGNFMEAADALSTSQSNLSKHIKNLEMELGAPLFDRTTRKVVNSKYGQLFLPYAQQITVLHDQCMTALKNSLETERDTLTLGTIPALAQYKITDILINFKKSRRQTTINAVQAGSEELKTLLRQKKCDLAFIRDYDEVDDDLVKIPYAVDTMVAVLPARHPLAGQKNLPLQMLADEDFLLVETHTVLYRLAIRACEQSGFKPKVVYTDHKLENLFDLVIKGMGVALLMKKLALYSSSPEIAIVDIAPSMSTQICLCYLKGTKLSEAVMHFILCTESQKKQL